MPCRVRGKAEKQISVKSDVESGEWHTAVAGWWDAGVREEKSVVRWQFQP